jgi:hypothetical protein
VKVRALTEDLSHDPKVEEILTEDQLEDQEKMWQLQII